MTTTSLLIIDDDAIFIEMVVRWLRQTHPAVTIWSALTPDYALILVKTFSIAPTYILVDRQMSDMNGLDLIRAMAPYTPESRFILITSFPDRTLYAQAAQLDIEVVVPKHTLANFLDTLLRGRHGETESTSYP
nr:response regulator [Ardenticatena sp.]